MTQRLDTALAARGLARSRTHAATLIAQGVVSVDGKGVVKPSTPVPDDAVLDVAGADHYVSRAAHKLLAGLDAFGIEVAGRMALDLGASTGGFTQVLRERGAEPVIALDVGHGQLSASVARDPGVIAIEGFNARDLSPESLGAASGLDTPPSIVTADLSFISLEHVLVPIRSVLAPGADAVLLIKPQFEVGRTAVKGGLVTDAAARADAISGVLWSAWDAGLGTAAIISSPLLGTHGNAEFVAHFVIRSTVPATGGVTPERGGNPTEWLSTVSRLAGER